MLHICLPAQLTQRQRSCPPVACCFTLDGKGLKHPVNQALLRHSGTTSTTCRGCWGCYCTCQCNTQHASQLRFMSKVEGCHSSRNIMHHERSTCSLDGLAL